MDIVSKEDLDKSDELPELKTETPVHSSLNPEQFQALLHKMANPVEAQKELAVQIKNFLDKRMSEEMSKKGYLSDFTRRWVGEYNNILEKIQKALYGDKNVSLHLHKVTHSQIAAKIRKRNKE